MKKKSLAGSGYLLGALELVADGSAGVAVGPVLLQLLMGY